jgi:hypothetical protein
MNDQLSRLDGLFLAAFLDQFLCQRGLFPASHHPAHCITAEDVQKNVKVIIRPFDRPLELGNIPGPDLVGPSGQKFRGLIHGMTELISTLPDFSLLVQNPIHAPHRAKIGPFIQHRCIDLPGRLIDKPIRVQQIQNLLPLFGRQCPRRNRPLLLREI